MSYVEYQLNPNDSTWCGGPFCVITHRSGAGKEQKEDGVYYYLLTVSGDASSSVNQGKGWAVTNRPKMITRQWDQFLYGTGNRRHVMEEQCTLLWQDRWICLGSGKLEAFQAFWDVLFLCVCACINNCVGMPQGNSNVPGQHTGSQSCCN